MESKYPARPGTERLERTLLIQLRILPSPDGLPAAGILAEKLTRFHSATTAMRWLRGVRP